MHFLNPEAFWALFLVAIPILIHLFNLRRIKKIYFSNLTFLRDISQQRKSRSTLKKLLILACRVLALVFLVLAFSRPVFEAESSDRVSGSHIIYLDNSLSMQRTDESGNLLLTNALNAVEGALAGLPKGNDIGLITNDRILVRLTSVTKTIEDLQEVDYSKNSTLLETIYDRIQRVPADELWVFSDLQRSTILPLEEILQDTSRRIVFYRLSSPIERNLYVDTVFLQKPLGIRAQNQLTIGIKNTGADGMNEVLVKVYKNDQQLSSFTINAPAGSVEAVSLEVGVNSDIAGDYRVEIEDTPIVFDNIYYFSINPVEKPLVVVLSESAPSDYLQSVYSNTEYFQLILTSTNNTSFQDLAMADLLVLDGLRTIPEWLLSQIDNLQGDILVIPSVNASISSYSQLLGFSIQQRDLVQSVSISSESLQRPFFEGVFNRRSDRMSMPEAKIRYSVSGYFRELISTDTDQPFLVEAGKGDIYFLTTPLQDSATNFQKHALFVPVMYKLAQNNKVSRLGHRLDEQTLVVEVDSLQPQSIVKLVSDDASFIPAHRYAENRLVMELPEVLNDPGFYYLIADEDTLQTVAMNYNKAESEIETVDSEEFGNLISGYDHVELEEISDIADFVKSNNNAPEADGLWKYALILALFFILSELLLLRFI